jgi:PiT family inorganic phosphate transporter
MWQYFSGAFLGWSLGSNDAANVFGTGVATNIVRFRTAVSLIAIFVILGAALEGPKCMTTLGELSKLQPSLAFISTLSAGLIIFAMSTLSLPVSTSQAIVGSLVTIGMMNGSADFSVLGKIVLCWVLTPVSAAILGAGLYKIFSLLLKPLLTSIRWRTPVLRSAIIIAGCYGAYTLGGNNVANVSGVYVTAGLLKASTAALFGGVAIALGVLTYSKNVMLTIGKGIFALDAYSAFISVLALALSSHIFTQIGVPISSTHAIVGAILGIGLLKDMHSISRKVVLNIFLGWIGTPILSGAVSLLLVTFYYFALLVQRTHAF